MDNENPQSARVTWNDAGQPISDIYEDIYFSTTNGLNESQYVFVEGNALPERFRSLHANETFTILETGFGTGLNFLCAWRCWNAHYRQKETNDTTTLNFISIEKHPIRHKDLQRALALFPEICSLSAELLEHYPPQPSRGFCRLTFNNNVNLTLIFFDIDEAIDQLDLARTLPSGSSSPAGFAGERKPSIDAVFLDGFSPQKNKRMWSNKVFLFLANYAIDATAQTPDAKNQKKQTTLATFTSASDVRRRLTEVGFSLKKIPGFGSKREMLVGYYPNTQTENSQKCTDQSAPATGDTWLFKSASKKNGAKIENVIVIGAGIAGSQVAFALAQRGINVIVIDKNRIAEQASGNLQGVVYTRLSPHDDPLSQFNLSAQLYADHFYEKHHFYALSGDQCGVLHASYDDKTENNHRVFIENFEKRNNFDKRNTEYRDYFRWVPAAETQATAGIQLKHGGLYLPRSGWLSPQDLCQRLLTHNRIRVYEHTTIKSLERTHSTWIAYAENRHFEADACVICNAKDALDFAQTQYVKINIIRGQVSHLVAENDLQNLQTVVCGKGYIAPRFDAKGVNIHSIGATFNLNDPSPELSPQDHQHNLRHLNHLFDTKRTNKPTIHPQSPGKVGFRTASPDYFPLVGPVPDYEAFVSDFALLSKKANAKIDHFGRYHDNLYLNIGYGSRGLAYSPLCAQLIADLIDGQFLNMQKRMYQNLHPARFIIRDIIRRKIRL